jgi:hypothetical protein
MASIDGLMIDLSQYRPLLVVSEPTPKLDYETKAPKRNNDGDVIFIVGLALVRLDGTKASVIDVSITTELIGITYGVLVQVTELVVSSWEMEKDRWGFTYRAAGIKALASENARPAPVAVPATSAPAPVRGKPGGEG